MAFDLGAKIGPGKFKFPLWAWGAAAVGGYYLYTHQGGAQAPQDAAGGQDSYDAYTGGYGDYTSPGGGGGGYGGGGYFPPTDGGGNVPPDDTITDPGDTPTPTPTPDPGPGGRDYRHRLEVLRNKRKAIKGQIGHLKEGGLTAAERRKVKRLRVRRKRITRRVHRIRAAHQ